MNVVYRMLLRAALRLYPDRFRSRFGGSMDEALGDRLAAADALPLGRRIRAKGRLLADLAVAGLKERASPAYRPPSRGIRAQRGGGLDRLGQDVRFAVRSLGRNPGFTATALATLSLGIGAAVAVFTVVHGVLLRPLPYPDQDGLTMVWSHAVDDPAARGWMSLPNLEDVRDLDVFESAVGWQETSVTYAGTDRPERVRGARVTGSLLEVLGLTLQAGRDIRPQENVPNPPPVVVVGHDFWQTRLGGRTDAVGSTVELSETGYEVVGVAPPGFDFPNDTELWIPYGHNLDGCGRGCTVYQVVARVAPGRTTDDAAGPLASLAADLQDRFPDTNTDVGFRVETLIDSMVGRVETAMWVLMGAVGMVLLIVCANLAGLLLARAQSRRGEVAVRSALGASRPRLLRQVLTESLVLALAGGVLGVLVGALLVRGLGWIAPTSLPRLDEVAMNGMVLAFALGTTGAVALLFGLSPALHLARSSPAEELTRAGRSGNRREGRARSWLIAAEIALSLSLLVGAGLLIRSLQELYRVDLGIQGNDVLRFGISLPYARYDDLEDFDGFFRELEDRIRALPGVTAVGSSFGSPLGGGSLGGSVLIDGRPPPPPGRQNYARVRSATPGYFEAMGLSLVRGRGIEPSDDVAGEPVVVVNETFAAQNFPNEDVLGARVRVTGSFGYAPTQYWRVVGVVGDVRESLTAAPYPAIYPPHAQFGPGFLKVHVRGATSAAVAALLPRIRDEVRRMDPSLPLADVETVGEAIRSDAAPTRFYLFLVGVFATLAVGVAAVGLYGVVAYMVSRRVREFGVRVALGASQPQIAGLVLRQGLVPTAWGLVAGLVLAAVGVRWLESLLFGIQPRDPLVFSAVILLVLAVSAAAILLPAHRSSRVDPTRALRAE